MHDDVLEPSWEEYVPAGQGLQGALPVALYWPRGQMVFWYHMTPSAVGHDATWSTEEIE